MLGKWVEDIDLHDETPADIIKVVYPDPGGMPNIKYEEGNSSDVLAYGAGVLPNLT